MNIGEAAKASGISRKMIRYYESIGLIEPGRSVNGYRVYGPRDIHALQFIGAARRLGFSLPGTGELLRLWQDRSRSSADVKRLADGHIKELRSRAAELQAMMDALEALAAACRADERPDCPIIEAMAKQGDILQAR